VFAVTVVIEFVVNVHALPFGFGQPCTAPGRHDGAKPLHTTRRHLPPPPGEPRGGSSPLIRIATLRGSVARSWAQTLLVRIPETPHEIEAAARSGTGEETQSFDAKAELPAPIGNASSPKTLPRWRLPGGGGLLRLCGP
jgi:hypothetical protein